MAKKQNTLGSKVVTVAGVLAALAAGAYFWSGGDVFPAEAFQKQTTTEITTPLYYEMKPLVVNIAAGNSQTRYLKIRPALVTRHQSLYDELPNFEPVVRNRLLSLYSQKSAAELLQPSGFENLREESLSSLQEALKDGTGMLTLSDVLFTEFVIQ